MIFLKIVLLHPLLRASVFFRLLYFMRSVHFATPSRVSFYLPPFLPFTGRLAKGFTFHAFISPYAFL